MVNSVTCMNVVLNLLCVTCSNPHPHFLNCMQNDVTLVHRCWSSFRKKTIVYYCIYNSFLQFCHFTSFCYIVGQMETKKLCPNKLNVSGHKSDIGCCRFFFDHPCPTTLTLLKYHSCIIYDKAGPIVC